MKTYRVSINFEEGVNVDVQANNAEEAEKKAIELAEFMPDQVIQKNITLILCIGIILHLMYKRWWHD